MININYLKRMILSFLAVALIAVPGAALAGTPTPVNKDMLEKGTPEIWLNPGSESPELIQRGRELGLQLVVGCSIVDLGVTPDQFP